LIVPETTSSGTGLAGMEIRVMNQPEGGTVSVFVMPDRAPGIHVILE
jgi:hypothetical protein